MSETPPDADHHRDEHQEPWQRDTLFCHDLPTKPLPEIGTVLVTGATGYIGGRLVPELLARGYRVRVMVRAESPEHAVLWPHAEIAEADALSPLELRRALSGVHTAYYLIHSLLLGPKGFVQTDWDAAHNFRVAAEEMKVKRIIYLGALGDVSSLLSAHLQSRAEVGAELGRGAVPATVLRAAIIIGSGSASYDLIRHLILSSKIVALPKWAATRCQPIAVRDAIRYLVGVLEAPKTTGESFDIGGADVLSYEQMLRIAARVFGEKRYFVPVPMLTIGPMAYFASLHTPVPVPITRCLFESLRNEVVCMSDAIRQHVPFVPLGFEEAVRRAAYRETQDTVRTRWSDAYPPTHEMALRLHELWRPARYITTYSLLTQASPAALFRSVCTIGGKEGWFWNTWMWRLRGMIDRLLLGVGAARGRKSHTRLAINDVIDFWRVEDLQPESRLLLRAEMKLPGQAWLEFRIKGEGAHNRLAITAYYDTHTVLGRLYWYVFLPFHHFIFVHLLEEIEKRSLASVRGIAPARGVTRRGQGTRRSPLDNRSGTC